MPPLGLSRCLWIGTGGGREDLRFLTEGGFDGAYATERGSAISWQLRSISPGDMKDTLWLFNVAMENGPSIDGLPIINGDFPWLC